MPDLNIGLFIAISFPLVLFPGPSVAFILASSLRGGRVSGLSATGGVEAGYLVHVLGAVCGVSAIIAASATAFTIIKLAGAAWLLWLAWHAFLSKESGTLKELERNRLAARLSPREAFKKGLLVGALNPKTAVFFVAFLPQFVRSEAGPVWVQLTVYGLLFIGLASIPDSAWALVGTGLIKLAPRLRLKVIDQLSGVVYTLLAAATLVAGRTSD